MSAKKPTRLEQFCDCQLAIREDFDSDGNQISWTCGAHLAEGRVFTCSKKSLEDAKYQNTAAGIYACADAKPPENKPEEEIKEIPKPQPVKTTIKILNDSVKPLIVRLLPPNTGLNLEPKVIEPHKMATVGSTSSNIFLKVWDKDTNTILICEDGFKIE